jgi:hypothetical protein
MLTTEEILEVFEQLAQTGPAGKQADDAIRRIELRLAGQRQRPKGSPPAMPSNCQPTNSVTRLSPEPLIENGNPLTTNIPLRQLDQRHIAVEVEIAGRLSVLRGVGHYEVYDPQGGRLRIELQDPAGVPEIQIQERGWDGIATVDTRFGCDYRIVLTSAVKS